MLNDSLTKSQSTRLYQRVVEHIENLIVNGDLQSGDRLPAERELTERFGVSRTVVREAVNSLQEKGLVEIRPGVGTFVHNGMSEIMRQSFERMVMIDQKHGLVNLMQVREILEPEIAGIAAVKRTDDDIEALQETIDRMDKSLHDVEAFITADHEFHLVLARATHNELIVNLIDSIVDSLSQQRRRIFLAGVNGPQRGQKHHIRILQAVIQQDHELARRYMIAHLLQIREDSTTAD